MTESLRAQAHQETQERHRPRDEITARRPEAAREQHAATDGGYDGADAGDQQRNGRHCCLWCTTQSDGATKALTCHASAGLFIGHHPGLVRPRGPRALADAIAPPASTSTPVGSAI